jgi:glycosyltransferase involved in cell wall biosynthesis
VTVSWVGAPPPVVARGEHPAAPSGRRVKVLHVITRLEAGAGGNTLLSAMGMDRGRYETWVAGGAGGPLWEEARRAGVRTVEIPGLVREVSPVADVRALATLTALVRRERFSVVHVHSAKAGVLGRVAAVLGGTPVIVCTVHGRDPWWPADPGGPDLLGALPEARRAFLVVDRALRGVTHAFVAVAPTVARDAVLARVAAPGRTHVAPSAVDLAEIPLTRDPAARADLGLPDDARVVGTVGRLDAQKAPLDFVRMAGQVTAARPDVRFVHIGEGELADQVEREARRLGVPLLLAGFRPDAPRLASAFDVYVVSSLYEGVGRGVTEAMASGRPVVATAVDGVVDLVAPGSTGLLVPPGDVTSLATATTWMLDHPVLAERMGAQGRDRVRALFATDVMCAALDEVYASLLGLEPLPPRRPRVARPRRVVEPARARAAS